MNRLDGILNSRIANAIKNFFHKVHSKFSEKINRQTDKEAGAKIGKIMRNKSESTNTVNKKTETDNLIDFDRLDKVAQEKLNSNTWELDAQAEKEVQENLVKVGKEASKFIDKKDEGDKKRVDKTLGEE